MVVVSHWQQSLMSQLKHHLDLLQLTFTAAGPSNVKVTSWIKVIQAAEQTHRNDCDKLFQKVSGIVFWLLFSLIVSSLCFLVVFFNSIRFVFFSCCFL